MNEPGIPNHIKYWRKRANLTLQALAEALEPPSSKGTISQYESASRGFSLSRLIEIAQALNTTPGAILDGPVRLPTPEELASMLAEAQREITVGVSFEDYPSAVASSLHAQLQRYAGVTASVAVGSAETSKGPGGGVQPRYPTKRASQG
jgi:transcriptional regulator with XRE-family HTH domain